MQGSRRHPTVVCQVGRAAKHRVDLTAALLYPAVVRVWLTNGLRPRNVLRTFGRAGGKRHLNCKQDSCEVCFSPVVMGLSPHLLLRCGLKAANAVGRERTPLFSLLKELKKMPIMPKHASLSQIKTKVSYCVVEICVERNREFIDVEEQ